MICSGSSSYTLLTRTFRSTTIYINSYSKTIALSATDQAIRTKTSIYREKTVVSELHFRNSSVEEASHPNSPLHSCWWLSSKLTKRLTLNRNQLVRPQRSKEYDRPCGWNNRLFLLQLGLKQAFSLHLFFQGSSTPKTELVKDTPIELKTFRFGRVKGTQKQNFMATKPN